MEKPEEDAHRQMPSTLGSGPDFSVVIVCKNNKAYLMPCIESLYQGKLRHRFDVIVVDNGSTDGTQDILRKNFSEVKIIQNDHNVGLSRASNQGIEATQGRYILLLNDDTLVNGPSLDAMAEFLEEHPEAAGVGGQLLNPDGTVQSCYNSFPTLRDEFLITTRLGEFLWKGYPAIMQGDQITPVGWIGSACLMLRRSALTQVGLLDEEYFIYGDEADLQYRLRRSGWKIYYIPQAQTIHFGGRSMNRWARRKMVYRGKILFYRKNYGPLCASVLRTMLGGFSLMKTLIWSAAAIAPAWREQALKELRSNLDVIKLCWKVS